MTAENGQGSPVRSDQEQETLRCEDENFGGCAGDVLLRPPLNREISGESTPYCDHHWQETRNFWRGVRQQAKAPAPTDWEKKWDVNLPYDPSRRTPDAWKMGLFVYVGFPLLMIALVGVLVFLGLL